MKDILIINPVSTDYFNELTVNYLKPMARCGTQMLSVNVQNGPKAIETLEDEVNAGPGVLKLVEDKAKQFDGIVINCFADPVVDAAQEISPIPIIGAGQASMIVAKLVRKKFAVISVYKKSGPWGELQAERAGTKDMLVYSTGIDISVLELQKDPDRTRKEILRESKFAIKKKGAELIILGCTGMALLAESIKMELRTPVVEPMVAALKIAETLIHVCPKL